jgi:hypothetical protein
MPVAAVPAVAVLATVVKDTMPVALVVALVVPEQAMEDMQTVVDSVTAVV